MDAKATRTKDMDRILDLALFGITASDISQAFTQLLLPAIPKYLDEFYIWLVTTPEYQRLFSGQQDKLDHVKRAQKLYWEQLFSGKFDAAYLMNREMVGRVHAKINLGSSSYFAAVNFGEDWWMTYIEEAKLSASEKGDYRRLLRKLILFDLSIVINAFNQEKQDAYDKQHLTIQQLASPVIELWDNVLVLPLVGSIDNDRALSIIETLLDKIDSTKSKYVIIDLTGASVIDTNTVQHLTKTISAASLLGSTICLSGISPDLARTLTRLNIKFSDVAIFSNLKHAFSHVYTLLNPTMTLNNKLEQ